MDLDKFLAEAKKLQPFHNFNNAVIEELRTSLILKMITFDQALQVLRR